MPDRLSRLVKTIVGSFPIKNPHPEKRQQRQIIDLPTIYHTKPFSPDHVSPQPIVKEEVREDVIPPTMVCSCCILSLFDDPMEGILGDLKEPPSVFLQAEMKREITS